MTPQHLYAVTEATWPAAATETVGPWTVRDGQGGGKRVSAATARQPVTPDDLPMAESAMQALGQTPLFMIRQGDEALDAMLADRGYAVIDPVNLYVAPVADLAVPPPHATTFVIWEPLAIQRDMWAEGGIGPARLAVMERAAEPKTTIIARDGQRPAATAFVGIHDGTAMIHALEVTPECRRHGIGKRVVHQAALWAQQNGASHVAALCTQANTGANALYAALHMALAGQYHYRIKEEANPT